MNTSDPTQTCPPSTVRSDWRRPTLRALAAGCLALALTALLPTAGQATIALTQGLTPGTTDWPLPVDRRMGPITAADATDSVTPSNIVSQTFTPYYDMALETIFFTYTASGTQAANSYTLKIQAVPGGDQAASYPAGTNLLATATYTFTVTATSTRSLMRFDFSGTDQIMLHDGTTYAVEIASTSSTLNLYRGHYGYDPGNTDIGIGGIMYNNRAAYYPYSGSTDTRDITMAVAGNSNVVAFTEGIAVPTGNIWPEVVDIAASELPGSTGVSANSSTIVSQTITPTTPLVLDTVYFAYSTSAASVANSFTLKVQTVPGGSGVQTYPAGTNLLPTTATFGLASTSGAIKLLRVGFGGTNKIVLEAGTTYAIEVSSTSSTVTFYRNGSDTYTGGAAYSNRSAINYPSTRDLALGVINQEIAGDTRLPIPQSFSMQIVPGGGTSNAELADDATMGFPNVRKGNYWSSTESTKGVYNFSWLDPIVTNCTNNGIVPWFTMTGSNSLYGETNPDSITTDAGRAGFANFAQATAQHYPQVKLYELWNEPNYDWSPAPGEGPYTQLMASMSPAIKGATPTAKIAGGVVNGTDFNWLEQCFQLGMLGNVDYVCLHPYRQTTTVGTPESVHDAFVIIHSMIRHYAPVGKRVEIISGEWGYFTAGTNAVSTTTQAQYLARMFLTSVSWGMPMVNWYNYKDSTTDATGSFGVVDESSNPKTAYYAAQTLMTVLDGFTFAESITVDAVGDKYLLRFTNSAGKTAYAFWTTDANTAVTLPIPAGSGKLYQMSSTTGSATSWSSSGLTVTLSGSPQYLTVN